MCNACWACIVRRAFRAGTQGQRYFGPTASASVVTEVSKHESLLPFLLFALFATPALCQQQASLPQGPRPCVLDTIENYVALGPIGCGIGSFLFYNVQYSATAVGGATAPTVMVLPVVRNTTLREGAQLTGLSLLSNWLTISGGSVTYTLTVSVKATSGAGIPGGVAAYGGTPFPSTFVPPNQAGLVSYSFSDSKGEVANGSNLFTDLTCNTCINTGGGAGFVVSMPQSMTLSYTQIFSAGTGGLVEEEEQFTSVEKDSTN